MNTALACADVMVAVFSQAYFDPARWTAEEWQAAVHAAKDRPRFLRPVRIDDTPPPPLLASLIATLPARQTRRRGPPRADTSAGQPGPAINGHRAHDRDHSRVGKLRPRLDDQ